MWGVRVCGKGRKRLRRGTGRELGAIGEVYGRRLGGAGRRKDEEEGSVSDLGYKSREEEFVYLLP